MALNVNPRVPKKVSKDTPEITYVIDRELPSKPARLFFAHLQTDISKEVVIKILRQYEDSRYNFRTLLDRQKCQLEALRWNTIFAEDVYIGIASVLKRTPKNIIVGGIIKDIHKSKHSLDSKYEYALIMKRLPEKRQLNYILEHGSKTEHKYYTSLLTQYVIKLHQTLKEMPIEEGRMWGSFEKIDSKLKENLALVDCLLNEEGTIEFSVNNSLQNYFFQMFLLKDIKRTFSYLRASLPKIIVEKHFQVMFEHRIQNHRINRCHGDLKAPNIWIDEGEEGSVHILDTIDFNPAFCNIDILSDFAMLVIDIEVLTKSRKIADDMISKYLKVTDQEDDISKSVLAFYLVEKAYVGAAISFMFDDAPDLGRKYLKAAKGRMKSLIHMCSHKSTHLQPQMPGSASISAKNIKPDVEIEREPVASR